VLAKSKLIEIATVEDALPLPPPYSTATGFPCKIPEHPMDNRRNFYTLQSAANKCGQRCYIAIRTETNKEN